jgi:hypothetical protein
MLTSDLNNGGSMVQFNTPPPRSPSFSQRLAGALGAGLETGQELLHKHQEEQALRSLGIEPGTPKEFAIESLRGKNALERQNLRLNRPETPLQRAQRLRIEQMTGEGKGEEDFLTRLMSGGEERGGETPDMAEEAMESGESTLGGRAPGRAPRAKIHFDHNDPATWSENQIDQFRSIQGKTIKAKTLARTAQNEYDRRKETKAASKKYKEATAPFQGALETLNQMEKIGTRGNLGIGSKVKGIVSPNTRRDRAEYERLGKSLISFASNIPIRNRQEFETLAHDLYEPGISDDSRGGILAAMKRIIRNSMQQFEAPEGQEEGGYQPRRSTQTRGAASKERPPLKSFLR